MSALWQDLRYGVRGLGRNRGFTLVALAALGVTIGLNSSLFSVYNAFAFRRWAVPDADRVVRVFQDSKGLSIAHYRYLAQNARTLAGVAVASWYETDQLAGGRVKAQYVSGSYFHVLAVPMHKGRAFSDAEDDPVRPQPVAVISHSAWQRFFRGDPDVVGRSVRLRDASLTIVGVAAPGFTGTELEPRDLFVPLAARGLVRSDDPTVRRFLTEPGVCCSTVSARLAGGVSRDEARAEIEHLSRRFHAAAGQTAQPITLADTALLSTPWLRRFRPAFGLMFASVALVLLLACANVGNLLLARAAARRHEIAVRLALGASRARVVRQLLTEGVVLAAGAALLGIGIAFLLPVPVLGAMFSMSPDTLASLRLEPDLGVLGFTVTIAVLACLAFALAPALHSTRHEVGAALKDRSARSARLSLRGGLLALQVAISVVLLSAAGLLARGLAHARSLDLGFATDHVALVTFDVPARYEGSGPRVEPLTRRLQAELEALPGAPTFALTSRYPLEDEHVGTTFRRPGELDGKSVRYEEVSAEYFDVLGIPVLRGRNFMNGDAAREVILVNETLAQRYWPDADPVGQTVVLDKDSPQTAQVVGVVRNARTKGLGTSAPAFYRPIGHRRPDGWRQNLPYVLLANADGHALSMMTALAARLDPDATAKVEPLARSVDKWLQPATVGAGLAAAVALLALALAMIGMAGVFGYAVHQRTREIGIRMALGAPAASILRLVLGSSTRAVGAGLAVGALGSAAAALLLETRLFGLSPLDPLAYALVLGVLAAAGLLATYVPARRAVRVDPTVALRCE